MFKLLLLLLWFSFESAAFAQSALKTAPLFEHYPAAVYKGKLSMPQLTTSEERRFRTELRHAITKGYDVVEGGTENERAGPNFAGHYVLVQWGCGTNCMEAAIIDGLDGQVLKLPRIPEDRESIGFEVPTGPDDLRNLQFQTKSRLLGIPYVATGETYWYVLEKDWRLIAKTVTPAN